MSPAAFNGFKAEHFNIGEHAKAFIDRKLNEFWAALEASAKAGKETAVDVCILPSWNWNLPVLANSKLCVRLLMVTAGKARGIVESVPEQGFEA